MGAKRNTRKANALTCCHAGGGLERSTIASATACSPDAHQAPSGKHGSTALAPAFRCAQCGLRPQLTSSSDLHIPKVTARERPLQELIGKPSSMSLASSSRARWIRRSASRRGAEIVLSCASALAPIDRRVTAGLKQGPGERHLRRRLADSAATCFTTSAISNPRSLSALLAAAMACACRRP